MGFGNRTGWLDRLREINPSVVAPLPGEVPAPRQPNAAKKEPKPKAARLGAPPRAPESALQTECVTWAKAQYPYLDRLLFAVPNGGHRYKATAAKLKREGVTRGVSDLFLALPRGGFAGLFLECKVGANDTSDAQDDFLDDALAAGYQTAVFWTLDQFQGILTDYLAAPPTVLGVGIAE